jgi:hypothetical protein
MKPVLSTIRLGLASLSGKRAVPLSPPDQSLANPLDNPEVLEDLGLHGKKLVGHLQMWAMLGGGDPAFWQETEPLLVLAREDLGKTLHSALASPCILGGWVIRRAIGGWSGSFEELLVVVDTVLANCNSGEVRQQVLDTVLRGISPDSFLLPGLLCRGARFDSTDPQSRLRIMELMGLEWRYRFASSLSLGISGPFGDVLQQVVSPTHVPQDTLFPESPLTRADRRWFRTGRIPTLAGHLLGSVEEKPQPVWGHALAHVESHHLRVLLNAGMDPDEPVWVGGKKAVLPLVLAMTHQGPEDSLARFRGFDERAEMVQLLLSKGATAGIRGPDGRTPLTHLAHWEKRARWVCPERKEEFSRYARTLRALLEPVLLARHLQTLLPEAQSPTPSRRL